MSNTAGFGFGDAIDPKQKEATLLPIGPAVFAIKGMKRLYQKFGSYGEQNIAEISFLVDTLAEPVEGGEPFAQEEVRIMFPLIFDMKWKLVRLFEAIGAIKPGSTEPFTPDWSKLENATGNCEISHRTYTKNEGKADEKKVTINDIGKFLPKIEDTEEKPW